MDKRTKRQGLGHHFPLPYHPMSHKSNIEFKIFLRFSDILIFWTAGILSITLWKVWFLFFDFWFFFCCCCWGLNPGLHILQQSHALLMIGFESCASPFWLGSREPLNTTSVNILLTILLHNNYILPMSYLKSLYVYTVYSYHICLPNFFPVPLRTPTPVIFTCCVC